jgi:hypothetical protein
MANTIGFGQAAVNNTNGFGKSATNNTIDFGEICADSWSPETNLTGTGGAIPYTNDYSLSLDGTDAYVTMGNTINMAQDGSDAFSFSFWMKRTSGSGIQTFLGKSQISAKGIRLYSNGNIIYMLIGTYTSACIFNQFNFINLNNGSWHHVVWTYDGSSTQAGMKLYINDSLKTLGSGVTNTPINLQNTTMDFLIGASGTSSSYNYEFNGNIDEVSYFDSELSASDVTSIYNGGVPNDISSLSPLGYWRCGDNNGGTGTTITDQGSGGNNGTLENDAIFNTDVPT